LDLHRFDFFLGLGKALTGREPARQLPSGFPARNAASQWRVGGAVAALVIPLIALAFGWRWAFIFSEGLGFIWLLVWLRIYHPLDRHPKVTAAEVSFIRAG
jgi:ACS family hexuronate transporter-like MFS transporter